MKTSIIFLSALVNASLGGKNYLIETYDDKDDQDDKPLDYGKRSICVCSCKFFITFIWLQMSLKIQS